MKRMYQRLLVRLALVVVAAILLLTVGTRALGLLLPFLLAYVAAWSVEPVARWLCRRLHESGGCPPLSSWWWDTARCWPSLHGMWGS